MDSSVLIDLLRDRTTPKVARLSALIDRKRRLLLGDLVLLEVLRGARDEGEAVRIRESLSGLSLVELGGERMIDRAALNYRFLRAKGTTMNIVDLLLATFCVANGHRLLHDDSDFTPMVEHLGLIEA